MSYVTRLRLSLQSCRSKFDLQAGNEQIIGLPPQTHRPGVRRQMRRKRFAERVLLGIEGEVPVFGEQDQVPGHLPFQAGLELHREGRGRRIRASVEMIDAGLAGVRGIGPLDGEARHARAHAEIGKDRAGPGRLDGEDRVREHHADGHGEGDLLCSQDAGGDGPVADRRLLADVEALPLGGGLQGPFGWPEGVGVSTRSPPGGPARRQARRRSLPAHRRRPASSGGPAARSPLPAARPSTRPCRRRRTGRCGGPARLAGPARPGCPT